jgi:hypothetical protein
LTLYLKIVTCCSFIADEETGSVLRVPQKSGAIAPNLQVDDEQCS